MNADITDCVWLLAGEKELPCFADIVLLPNRFLSAIQGVNVTGFLKAVEGQAVSYSHPYI